MTWWWRAINVFVCVRQQQYVRLCVCKVLSFSRRVIGPFLIQFKSLYYLRTLLPLPYAVRREGNVSRLFVCPQGWYPPSLVLWWGEGNIPMPDPVGLGVSCVLSGGGGTLVLSKVLSPWTERGTSQTGQAPPPPPPPAEKKSIAPLAVTQENYLVEIIEDKMRSVKLGQATLMSWQLSLLISVQLITWTALLVCYDHSTRRQLFLISLIGERTWNYNEAPDEQTTKNCNLSPQEQH